MVYNQVHVMMARIQYLNILPDEFLLKCIYVQGRSLHTLCSLVRRLADSGYFENLLYQGGVKSTVSWVLEDLKFKSSEGYDQNFSLV